MCFIQSSKFWGFSTASNCDSSLDWVSRSNATSNVETCFIFGSSDTTAGGCPQLMRINNGRILPEKSVFMIDLLKSN